VEYDTYSAEALQLAVDLANTDVASRADVEEYLRVNDEWFVNRDATLLDADLASIAGLSRHIRAVVESTTDDEAVTRLNTLLECCSPEPRVTNHDGSLHLHYSPDTATLVDQLGATVAMGMAQVVCRYGRERLGICAAEDCADVFVDTSRNRSRRYCSETCASRTTVSAYRARQRAAQPDA
jgi:predicted RNA-binding Zn ribbon-like protein